jgi:hypothetical protein
MFGVPMTLLMNVVYNHDMLDLKLFQSRLVHTILSSVVTEWKQGNQLQLKTLHALDQVLRCASYAVRGDESILPSVSSDFHFVGRLSKRSGFPVFAKSLFEFSKSGTPTIKVIPINAKGDVFIPSALRSKDKTSLSAVTGDSVVIFICNLIEYVQNMGVERPKGKDSQNIMNLFFLKKNIHDPLCINEYLQFLKKRNGINIPKILCSLFWNIWWWIWLFGRLANKPWIGLLVE